MFAAGMSLSILGFTLVQLFPGAFIAIFNDKPELVQATEWAMHIYFGGMFMLGMQFSCQQTFVALGQARVSLFLALLRKIVLLIPLVYLLPGPPRPAAPPWPDREVYSSTCRAIADTARTVTGLVFLCKFPRILKKRTEEL
jgi:Na+-driven multidrug efflux pump